MEKTFSTLRPLSLRREQARQLEWGISAQRQAQQTLTQLLL